MFIQITKHRIKVGEWNFNYPNMVDYIPALNIEYLI